MNCWTKSSILIIEPFDDFIFLNPNQTVTHTNTSHLVPLRDFMSQANRNNSAPNPVDDCRDIKHSKFIWFTARWQHNLTALGMVCKLWRLRIAPVGCCWISQIGLFFGTGRGETASFGEIGWMKRPDERKSCCTSTQDYGIDLRCQLKNKGWGELKPLEWRESEERE